jgi:ATP-binding cassette subfamily F protein uup
MVPTPLISAQEITKGYSEHPLFAQLSLAIHENERLALIGSNGCGKSTLLKILAGIEEVDSGIISVRKGLRCAYVPQTDIFPAHLSIGEIIEGALADSHLDHGEIARRRSVYLGATGFHDDSITTTNLSGGWKKRLSIACALALEPDCLLLDEPTNHLDIDSIMWLERYLATVPCATVFVSHDRYFIERLASRVLEIHSMYPNNILVSEGGYADYIEYREERLNQLQQQRRSLANKVRREVEWLRQGVKARTTKSRARINEAHRMIDVLKGSPHGEAPRAELDFSSTQRRTKELLKAERIGQSINGTPLFSDISLVLSPRSRLAIVGPNGSGKTTFIRTLLGEIAPTSGRIIRAPNMRVACMDQTRSQLKDELRLKEFLCPHGDSVSFQGEPIHVAAWAARFLFTHNHLTTTLASLSGGERARALLAKIMAEECDVLVFDEPTNDLDIATLENLQESFESFPGAIVLITHDRYLLERTASSVLGLLDGEGTFYGSYAQWEAARENASPKSSDKKASEKGKELKNRVATKLSYKDAQELSKIEKNISTAEEKLAAIKQQLDSGEFASNALKLSELCEALNTQQAEVDSLYERWQALEHLRESFKKS